MGDISMSTQPKRMGGLGKLSDFGRTPQPETPVPPELPIENKLIRPLDSKPISLKQDQLVSINIKISRSQQDWLANTARNIRDNNTAPVPASDRVYPQHLIQVAINLLQNTDVDWSEITDVESLKKALNL
jgi:hypothetical protein